MPKVLLVVDPLVSQGLKDLHEQLVAFAAEHKFQVVECLAKLKESLAAGRPDFLYWLGHSTPESLDVGNDQITPAEFQDLLELAPSKAPGGLVFLNACQTAERAAGGTSFVNSVFLAQLGGMVGTEQVTVDTFAAQSGLQFLKDFLIEGKTVGTAIKSLRTNVPMGLLYGVYCPPEIRFARPGTAAPQVVLDGISPAATVTLSTVKSYSAPSGPLPDAPYRSLQHYGPEDRALFAGRDDDVLRFAQILDAPSTRLLILHGESGVGKTSFLRAGVIPYLETECVGYQFARDHSKKGGGHVLTVRSTNDPVSMVAAALSAFCAEPLNYSMPDCQAATTDLPAILSAAVRRVGKVNSLRDALGWDPGVLSQVLAALAEALPFTPVLVIDQAEEVFTLARHTGDAEGVETVLNRQSHALEMLSRAAVGSTGFKLIVSLRTEYYGRFVDRLRTSSRDAGGVREYLLTDFGEDALAEVVRRPTKKVAINYATDVPYQKYLFSYHKDDSQDVARELARLALAVTRSRQDSVLPLVQVICTQLYERAISRADRVIYLEDLAQIGGFEGGLKRHAEGLLRENFPDVTDQTAFLELVAGDATRLYLEQSDRTLTTALLPVDTLEQHWSGRMPFEAVLRIADGGTWRLLRVNSLQLGGDELERQYVSLGHDALAKVVAVWHEELKKQAHARKYAEERKTQIRKYSVATLLLTAVASVLTVVTFWALKQKNQANLERARMERLEYLATVRLANLEWNSGNFFENTRLLDRYFRDNRSENSNPDYRGFEWHYQWRRSNIVTRVLRGNASVVTSASFSLDGTRIVTAGHDKTVRVWEATTGTEVTRFTHDLALHSASFSPDGSKVLTTSMDNDNTARVIDATNGTPFHILQGHVGHVNSASFSPDGSRVATASDDRTARVWDAATGKEIARFEVHDTQANSASFSPDGSRVVTACTDGTARVWYAVNSNVTLDLKGHSGDVLSASFSPDGSRVVTACDGGRRLFGGGDTGGSASVWNVVTGNQIVKLKHNGAMSSASFSPDGSRVVTAGRDKTARVWDAATGTELVRLEGHTGPVGSASFSPDGSRVATASNDRTARVWDSSSR